MLLSKFHYFPSIDWILAGILSISLLRLEMYYSYILATKRGVDDALTVGCISAWVNELVKSRHPTASHPPTHHHHHQCENRSFSAGVFSMFIVAQLQCLLSLDIVQHGQITNATNTTKKRFLCLTHAELLSSPHLPLLRPQQ